MTYPSTGGHGPSVPAGGVDRSDSPAGAPTAGGVPRAAYYDGSAYHAHRDRGTEDTSVPTSDPDRDDGLPDVPRYEGPSVPEQAPLVNPSAGTQGPSERGMTDVNPRGAAPHPGSTGPVNTDQAPHGVGY